MIFSMIATGMPTRRTLSQPLIFEKEIKTSAFKTQFTWIYIGDLQEHEHIIKLRIDL